MSWETFLNSVESEYKLESEYAINTLEDLAESKKHLSKDAKDEIRALAYVLESIERSVNGKIRHFAEGMSYSLMKAKYPDLVKKHYDGVFKSLKPGAYQDYLDRKQGLPKPKRRARFKRNTDIRPDEKKDWENWAKEGGITR